MKFTTLTTTLLTTTLAAVATALPTSPSGTTNRGLLTKRAAFCTPNSIEDTTTPSSALVSDCLTLSTTTIPQTHPDPWTPSESNNHTLEITHNTCGLRVHFLGAPSGSLDASQVVLGAAELANLVDLSVAWYATGATGTDGQYEEGAVVGATGQVICIQAGMVTHVGWVDFEVYRV